LNKLDLNITNNFKF